MIIKKIEHIDLILLFFLAIIFVTTPVQELGTGLMRLIISRDTLITDYTSVSGIGPTLLNVFFVMAFTLFVQRINRIELNGFVMAGLLTTMGFSFFGKNIYNILPVYAGVYLYSRFNNKPFRQYFVIAMFGAGLAPIATNTIELNIFWIILGISIKIFYGFILVPLASHIIRFHNGYVLYNIGFTGGIFAMLFTGIFRTLGYELDVVVDVNQSQYVHQILLMILLSISGYFLLFGIIKGGFCWHKYKRMMSMSGRAITDYYGLFGEEMTLINMGVVGLLLTMVALSTGLTLNGATVGSIISVIGFAAFGKNPKNITPVIIGCLLIIAATNATITPAVILTIIFVTGLAPLAGEYGFFIGIIAGVMQFCLDQYTADWQGGANLYNNGFAGGFVAGIIHSIMDSLFRRKA